MIQPIPQPVTFDEFVAWYPQDEGKRYELHNGVIFEMPLPTGDHSEITGFLYVKIGIEIDRLSLPYFIPKECILKSDSARSGYEPDIVVLDRQSVESEPRWKKESIITIGSSVRLAVEVVSTNWGHDYGFKLIDYEALGVLEYWIVDYLGLGGKRYIGNPKQPTLSIYHLVDGDYVERQFREGERIESPTFPQLNLTTSQIFRAVAPSPGN